MLIGARHHDRVPSLELLPSLEYIDQNHRIQMADMRRFVILSAMYAG